MSLYCVSYDLNKAGQNYAALHKELENSTNWWHHLDSTWLIYTTEDASRLADRLRKHIDKNDSLLVIRVRRDYTGWLPQEAWDWIEQYIDT
jgi:hypothetical protein